MTPWPLSVAFPLSLLGAVALILACDCAGAAIARGGAFDYRKLWPVQFGLYVVIGFVAMLAVLDLRLVEAIGAITGFVEATLGWAITWRIGPGRIPNPTPLNVAVVILSMTAFGFGFAIAGALLFNAVASLVLRTHAHG